jgi:hypothetical protein
MQPLEDAVHLAFPPSPSHRPAPGQAETQRRALLSHISETTNRQRSGGHRTLLKRRVPLGVALGLALSGLGGGIGWAVDSSSSPSVSPSHRPTSITYTACGATTSSGARANYVVVGTRCGPGHVPPGVGFTPESPPHTYCVISGEARIPRNMILVVDSAHCPSGYVTTSPLRLSWSPGAGA